MEDVRATGDAEAIAQSSCCFEEEAESPIAFPKILSGVSRPGLQAMLALAGKPPSRRLSSNLTTSVKLR